jgi:hypothetical protein
MTVLTSDNLTYTKMLQSWAVSRVIPTYVDEVKSFSY